MTPRVREILDTVSAIHGVSPARILSPCRKRTVAYARFDAMARLRAVRGKSGAPQYSLPAIGKIFDRDHTTVLASLRRAEEVFGPRPAVSCAPIQDPEEGRL